MKKVLLLSLVLLLGIASGAGAALSGTLYSNISGGTDTSGGLVAINALVGRLDWSVDLLTAGEDAGKYQYTYTLTPYDVKNRGAGSINLEFGSQPTDLAYSFAYNWINGTNPGAPAYNGTLQTIDRTLAGSTPPYTYNSWLVAADPVGTNVNVSTTFQGLQWILDSSSPVGSSFTLTLTTALAPMWGDIYMDGYNMTSTVGYGMIRNTLYDIAPGQAFSLDGEVLAGYVPTPGVVSAAPVPIPPSILLLVGGLGGLGIIRRRIF